MALNEQKTKFCELYAFKEDLKLNHDLIAGELGISTKTIQRWLKEPEVIAEINRICASRLDRLIPTLTANTESLLNSKSANDKLKGMDSYWRLQEKLNKTNECSITSREQKIIEECGKLWLKDMCSVLSPEEAVKVYIAGIVDYVIGKHYEKEISWEEVDRILKDYVPEESV